jgi:hypothetical protein
VGWGSGMAVYHRVTDTLASTVRVSSIQLIA